MTQCQFIYTYNYAGRTPGTQCINASTSVDGRFCRTYRSKNPGMTVTESVDEERRPQFPRVFSEEEERMWVNEARRRTDPMLNIMSACVVYGQLCRREEITLVTEADLIG